MTGEFNFDLEEQSRSTPPIVVTRTPPKRVSRQSDEFKKIWSDISEQVSFVEALRTTSCSNVDNFLWQEVITLVDDKFESGKTITHSCDPFAYRLTRSLVDVRSGFLSEEAINTFIRIVISQVNTFHASAKIFEHMSSQTLPLFVMNGKSAIVRKKQKNALHINHAIQARVILTPSLTHSHTPSNTTQLSHHWLPHPTNTNPLDILTFCSYDSSGVSGRLLSSSC